MNRATSLKGLEAGHLPSQVNSKKEVMKDQNVKRERGEDEKPLKIRLEENIENKNSPNTAMSRATTPPNLLGIERKIA